jgi:peptidoglycan hydrolase-like protein with peptidoglycan-binding domain
MSNRDERWAAHRQELEAAAKTAGIDVDVMVKIAGFESGFNPNARPISTSKPELNTVTQYDGTKAISSAHGYGQFLNGTWHDMVQKYGEKYGVANAADMTKEQTNSPKLRENTKLQAGMLAEFTRENIERASQYGGKDVDANVYAMHNLGSTDAVSFLSKLRDNPNARVDSVLSSKVISGNPALYGDGSISLQSAYAKMGDHMDRYQGYADEATRGLPSGTLSHTAAAPSRAARDPMADGMLSPNERGAPVEQLQQQLNALGYTDRNGKALGTDGSYGDNTRHAVENFQRDHGLTVDGVAGRDTLQALRSQAPGHAQAAPAQAPAAAAVAAGAAAVAGTAAVAATAAPAKAAAEPVAPTQPAAPATGGEGIELNRAYELTKQFDHVKYGFGDKKPESGAVDCSGWVVRLANQSMAEINEKAGRDVFTKADQFSPGFDHAAGIIQKASERSGTLMSGKEITANSLREGMIIGEDNGAKGWDRGRFNGIDHITMVVRDPTDGQLKVSQSRSGEGVEMIPLQGYLDRKHARGVELFATDPLANGRDLIKDGGGRATAGERAPAANAAPGKAESTAQSHPTLREDSRGSSVHALQESLNKLGYTDRNGKPLDVDSKFGAHTEEAVKAFQRDKGLSADGVVGPKTHAALDQAREQTKAPQAEKEGNSVLSSLFNAAREGNADGMRNALAGLAETPAGRAFTEMRDNLQQQLNARQAEPAAQAPAAQSQPPAER